MNADHEEAVEFSKISKRENRVYVGNLSYDVKYRDLMEFMRGGGWGNFSLFVIFSRILGGSLWRRPIGVLWWWSFFWEAVFSRPLRRTGALAPGASGQESFVAERSRCFSFCLMEWSSC